MKQLWTRGASLLVSDSSFAKLPITRLRNSHLENPYRQILMKINTGTHINLVVDRNEWNPYRLSRSAVTWLVKFLTAVTLKRSTDLDKIWRVTPINFPLNKFWKNGNPNSITRSAGTWLVELLRPVTWTISRLSQWSISPIILGLLLVECELCTPIKPVLMNDRPEWWCIYSMFISSRRNSNYRKCPFDKNVQVIQ